MADPAPITTPFPIFLSGNHYFLYDINTISYARRVHNICGVLIGTIPHIAQQNVFSGVPLELLPEEARVLVEKGHAYVVDDVKAHDQMMHLSPQERKAFMKILEKQGKEASAASQTQAEKKKEAALKKKGKNLEKAAERELERSATPDPASELSLFATPTTTPSKPSAPASQFFVTPPTSHPPLPTPPRTPELPLPAVTHSYPLFAYLHSKGFFISPGLRFGCQYCVYPGDPLRFHSHYLAVGKKWDEEFDMLDVVGGGRLGTAVKKAYVIGGAKAEREGELGDEKDVRAFCIEWAGM